MSLDRDDLFFRQFLDWYIGKTIYRVISGMVLCQDLVQIKMRSSAC